MPIEPRFIRKIADVKEALEQAQRDHKRCTLLVGAGCSVTAGVPSAEAIIDIIRQEHGSAYTRAIEACGRSEPSYADCHGVRTSNGIAIWMAYDTSTGSRPCSNRPERDDIP